MLRGLILDLDGVVVDSHPAHKQAWRVFLRSVGREVSEEELEFVLEGGKREAILRHFLGPLTDEQVKHYGAQKNALFGRTAPELKIIHGLLEFLEETAVAGLLSVLASSASRNRVLCTLRQLGLAGRFQTVLTSEDVPRGKPDPAIFELATLHMNLSPNEILVCEDGVSGVEAAKAAGIKCLAIAANGRGLRLKQAGADMVVPDFTAVTLDDLRALFV
jgi:beta-phosphoglucomutase